MKSLILVAGFVMASQSALACLGEAQIIARATKITPQAAGSCQVSVEFSSVKMFNENQTCPLDISEVVAYGFSVRNCTLKAGDDVSGIIVVDSDGQLVLE